MKRFTRRSTLGLGLGLGFGLAGTAAAIGAGVVWHRRHAAKSPAWLNSFVTPEPTSLVPGFDPAPSAALVAGKIYQGLLRFSEDMRPVPDLAERWSIDQGGHRCLFTIRQDVRFHDGRVLTARDVAFSIRRQQGAAWAWMEVAAPDPASVVLTGPGRFDRLLPLFDAMSCPILPEEIQGHPHHDPIGTGPFQLDRWNPGQEIRLRRFGRYWRGGQPMLDGITYRVVPDPAARLAQLQSGAAQIAQLHDILPQEMPALRHEGTLAVDEAGWTYLRPLCRLECGAALHDPLVRQAIGLAVDRDDLVQRVWSGSARASGGPLPVALSAMHPPPPSRDPRAAAALLQAAGSAPDEQGVRLRLRLLLPGWDPIWHHCAVSIGHALRQIGVVIQPEPAVGADWQQRLATRDYDLALRTAPSRGNALLCLAETWLDQVGDALGDARDAADDAAYRAAIARAEQDLLQSHAAIWLFEPLLPTVFTKTLHNPLAFATGPFAAFDYVFVE